MELTRYFGWNRMPSHLKTRGQWELNNRRVVNKARPVAELALLEIRRVRGGETENEDGSIEKRPDQKIWKPTIVGLFTEEQTKPFTPSSLELSHRAFFRYFVQSCRRSLYIWNTEGEWKWCFGHLSRAHVKDHIYGKQIYGVLAGGGEEFLTTRFGAIDLDLHDNGDLDVFLKQAEVLIHEFCGRDGWHLQIKNEKASGLHLIQLVPKTLLGTHQARLRQRLQKLDEGHPQLADAARRAGMKTLGQVEVFPDCVRGFRLPLCRDRTMLLDKPLPLIQNIRGRWVQDVVGYMEWIEDSARQYMPAEEILQYVKERVAPPAKSRSKSTEQKTPRTDERPGSAVGKDQPSSLRELRQNCGDWIRFVAHLAEEGLPTHDTVGEAVYELAKWFLHVEFQHHDEGERVARTEEVLFVFVSKKHNGFVTRWNNGKESMVVRQIARIVTKATKLPAEYARRLHRIRQAQDDGYWEDVIELEPVIRGEVERITAFSSNATTPPDCSIQYLSLQVLREGGRLDEKLPDTIEKIIAEHKGRQKIDLFAKRFLNALYYSPGYCRLVSYQDIYQMIDPEMDRGTKEKPTLANQYLVTLRKRAKLVERGRCYSKGKCPNEFILSKKAVALFRADRST